MCDRKVLGEQQRGPWRAVAHDDCVDSHGFDILGRVDEGFALADARSARAEIDGIGAKAASGQAETGARARGRLEEQIDDGFAVQDMQLLFVENAEFPKLFGSLQDRFEFCLAEIFQIQQMTTIPDRQFCFRLL